MVGGEWQQDQGEANPAWPTTGIYGSPRTAFLITRMVSDEGCALQHTPDAEIGSLVDIGCRPAEWPHTAWHSYGIGATVGHSVRRVAR